MLASLLAVAIAGGGTPGAPGNLGAAAPETSGGPTHVAQIAIDADFEFFQANGGDLEQTLGVLEAMLGEVGGAFAEGPGVALEVAAIVVRTDAADPYSANDPGELFQQVRDEWLTNHPDVEWDAVQLVSGRNFGGAVVGIAGPSSLCTTNAVSAIEGASLAPVDLAHRSAYHLGLVFGATACQDATCGVMCPLFGGCGAPPLQFGPQAIAQIQAYIDANGSCLDVAGCPADCDADGSLDVLDFVCFQGLFTDANPRADCNGDGELNVLDFVCFQGVFLAGCP